MDERKRLILEAGELRAMLDDAAARAAELAAEKAAEAGARKAMALLGLHDEEAAGDVRDLRQLMSDWRAFRRAVLSALGNVVTLGVLALLGAGLWWHFHKGPPPPR